MRTRPGVGTHLLLAGTLLAAPSFATPMFTGLGDLPGGIASSLAWEISGDGSTVVGESRSASGTEAFRWTSAGGMVGLGDLPGGTFSSRAFGVSADGSTIVGLSSGTGGGSPNATQAFRWTSASGMAVVGDLPGGAFRSEAHAVSADSSTVVGISAGVSGSEAFRWTSAGGMVGLGELPGGRIFHSEANGVSSDGSFAAGYSESGSGREAFVWTSGSGMVGLGDLAGGGFESTANGVSADGSTVVGYGTSASGREAFLWTTGSGLVGLGDLPGGFFTSNAFAVSADGSVVVGSASEIAANPTAFVWDSINGMRSIQRVLENSGLDLTGWTLLSALGVSADGKTITGYGMNPSGSQEAWIAVLPEADTALLLVSALAAIAASQRRGRRRDTQRESPDS